MKKGINEQIGTLEETFSYDLGLQPPNIIVSYSLENTEGNPKWELRLGSHSEGQFNTKDDALRAFVDRNEKSKAMVQDLKAETHFAGFYKIKNQIVLRRCLPSITDTPALSYCPADLDFSIEAGRLVGRRVSGGSNARPIGFDLLGLP